MTRIDREQIAERLRHSEILRALWQRERQIELTAQLALNDEIKLRWEQSNPIEISQRQAVNGQGKI